jgi:hypothetical protein
MDRKSQIKAKDWLVFVLVLAVLPSLAEAAAVIWGVAHGFTGKALRDGLDLWAGGYLVWHGQALTVFDPAAYRAFVRATFGGNLPTHLWSYPPNYLFLISPFGLLPPWPAVLCFDALSLTLLAGVLRLAGQKWGLIAAVVLSPVSLESLLEHQNAALMTALIGGAVLLLPARPTMAGVLGGLGSIKPQLGLTLPLFLWRRSRAAFFAAFGAALVLAGASYAAFGPAVFQAFWTVTRPAMTAVLLTGKPPEFANGLISVFAAAKPLGIHAALAIQAVVTIGAVAAAALTEKPAVFFVLTALASPYLHDYDLLGVALAVALVTQDRLRDGFARFEPLVLFAGWFLPGALPWLPQFAHAVPVLLVLLAFVAARDRPGVDEHPES